MKGGRYVGVVVVMVMVAVAAMRQGGAGGRRGRRERRITDVVLRYTGLCEMCETKALAGRLAGGYRAMPLAVALTLSCVLLLQGRKVLPVNCCLECGAEDVAEGAEHAAPCCSPAPAGPLQAGAGAAQHGAQPD